MRSLHDSFGFHVLQQRFVVPCDKPVTAEESRVKLALQVFRGDPFTVVILQIRGGVRQISHLTQDLGTVADLSFSATPLLLRIQSRG
jgi:hypothetical protein